MKSIHISILIVFLTISSCRNAYKNELEFYTGIITEHPNNFSRCQAYIFLPPVSCVPCNNYSVETSINMLNKNFPIKVFLGCYPENYKLLMLKLKKIEYQDERIIIDTSFKYNISFGKYYGLPVILYLNGNKIKNIDAQYSGDPQAFERLVEKFLEN